MATPSVLELLKKSEKFLSDKGVSNARLQAELLFAYALQCERTDLYTQSEVPLNKAQIDELRTLIVRRGKREPIQYIVGDTDFRTLTLNCDPRALIPRPETEELLDHVFQLIDAIEGEKPLRVLDLGTGTGAIALSVAMECEGMKVTAVDSSEGALSLAEENATLCGTSEVKFLLSNWFENVEGEFDVIISNPPYLSREEFESAEPEVRDHEPAFALLAEDSGISELEKILRSAFPHLTSRGFIALETGIAHHERLTEIAKEVGYQRSNGACDLSGHPRFFFATK